MTSTVLVIEDDALLLDNILTLLSFEQYQGIGATNGIEGIALAREHLPDLILCDIEMPQLDGYGVLLALRDDPATRTIPLIFLTGKSEHNDLRYGMELGANDYITKPFTHEEFINAVQARLERRDIVESAYQGAIDSLRHSIVFALPLELRAPLAEILGYADRLIATSQALAPPDVHAIGATMLNAATLLHRQIENYLLFAQLEILRLVPERVIVQRETGVGDPVPLITAIALHSSAVHQRPEDVQVTVTSTPLHITEHSLRKIVEELLGHAFSNSAPGTPVTITGEPGPGPETYSLHITAAASLSPAAIAALESPVGFIEQLRDLHASTLGLIVAHHLLDAHGGALQWDTTPDGSLHWIAQLARHANNCAT